MTNRLKSFISFAVTSSVTLFLMHQAGTSHVRVAQDVNAHLPGGSSHQQVADFIKQRSIETSALNYPPSDPHYKMFILCKIRPFLTLDYVYGMFIFDRKLADLPEYDKAKLVRFYIYPCAPPPF